MSAALGAMVPATPVPTAATSATRLARGSFSSLGSKRLTKTAMGAKLRGRFFGSTGPSAIVAPIVVSQTTVIANATVNQ